MPDYPISSDGTDVAFSLYGNVARDWGSVDALGRNNWTMGPANTTAPVTIYKMRGMDAAVSGVYDTWLVSGAPDLDASDYSGPLATPLRDVIVIDTWSS